MVDNVLRPILVGRDTRMPDYVVLISTLGGLQAFGIHGFIIGPVVAALFIGTWNIFTEQWRTPRAKMGGSSRVASCRARRLSVVAERPQCSLSTQWNIAQLNPAAISLTASPYPAATFRLPRLAGHCDVGARQRDCEHRALPTIAADLHASPSVAVWVINAYQLAITVLLPLAALGDRIGHARVYLPALGLFIAGSLACALAGSLPALIAARMTGDRCSRHHDMNAALVQAAYPSNILGRGMGYNHWSCPFRRYGPDDCVVDPEHRALALAVRRQRTGGHRVVRGRIPISAEDRRARPPTRLSCRADGVLARWASSSTPARRRSSRWVQLTGKGRHRR